MNIFDLHASFLTDDSDFVRSFFSIVDERARQTVETEPPTSPGSAP